MLTKSLKGKDFISLMDYSREELETILEVSMVWTLVWTLP